MNEINDDDIINVIEKIKKILNKNKLTIPELIVMYGNLGYHIGASIAGLETPGPTLEVLQKEYYTKPTVDVGLMLQGLLITDWVEDFLKHPQLSSLAKSRVETKE